jgi:uncharacterized Zn-finger protein
MGLKSTISCPHCHQIVDSQAITCPHCRTQLKAFGHPGIPLHRAKQGEYLCKTCSYEADNSCTYPQRPYARECTLYDNLAERQWDLEKQQQQKAFSLNAWVKKHQGLLLLFLLLVICLVIAISTS